MELNNLLGDNGSHTDEDVGYLGLLTNRDLMIHRPTIPTPSQALPHDNRSATSLVSREDAKWHKAYAETLKRRDTLRRLIIDCSA